MLDVRVVDQVEGGKFREGISQGAFAIVVYSGIDIYCLSNPYPTMEVVRVDEDIRVRPFDALRAGRGTLTFVIDSLDSIAISP